MTKCADCKKGSAAKKCTQSKCGNCCSGCPRHKHAAQKKDNKGQQAGQQVGQQVDGKAGKRMREHEEAEYAAWEAKRYAARVEREANRAAKSADQWQNRSITTRYRDELRSLLDWRDEVFQCNPLAWVSLDEQHIADDYFSEKFSSQRKLDGVLRAYLAECGEEPDDRKRRRNIKNILKLHVESPRYVEFDCPEIVRITKEEGIPEEESHEYGRYGNRYSARKAYLEDFETEEDLLNFANIFHQYGWNDDPDELGPPLISDLIEVANSNNYAYYDPVCAHANHMLRERGLDAQRGWTIDPPIVQYARVGDKKMVQAFLTLGVPMDECLCWYENGEYDEEHDDHANIPRYGDSALMAAAREGHKDIVLLLLDNGASKAHECCYEVGKFDKGPAAAAIRSGRPNIADLINKHWSSWQRPITDFFNAKDF